MPTTSHRYTIPDAFVVDPLLPPTACLARPDSPLGERLAAAEAVAFPEAPDLFGDDDTTLMLGMKLGPEIRHVMRLSIPLIGEGAEMPFLLRDLVESGQGVTEADLVAFYRERGIDLSRSVSVETNVRVGEGDGDISSADLAYLSVFEVMRRIKAQAVFAHLNDAARSSFRRVDLQGEDILDRDDIRTPGAEAGVFDERYRPVCLPAHEHNVAVIQALASLVPATIWSPAPPTWWDEVAGEFTPLPTSSATPTVKRVAPKPPVDIDLTDPDPSRTPSTQVAEADGKHAGLHITVRTGIGTGPTHLAAFDAALRQAGVADRNLIPLSSIVPPASVVERTPEATTCPGQWGDRLYVVMAEERVERPHEEAWAGIAWRQDPETGEGLFVEHHGHSKHQVETDLLSTIESITAGRDHREWGEPELAVVGVTCEDEPVCALAIACFQSDPWRPGDPIDLRDR